MNILNEEIKESEFFILRKFFSYPVKKKKFIKYVNALLGQNYFIVHNLFITQNIKKCIKKTSYSFKIQLGKKDKYSLAHQVLV